MQRKSLSIRTVVIYKWRKNDIMGLKRCRGNETMGKCLGLFDSGFGGLTVLKELLRKNQYDRYVYFGDTLRVPYGTRDAQTIRAFALADARFLRAQGVDELVVACNTITAVALDALRDECGVAVHGVIEPTVQAAVAATKNGRIGLLATQATIDNGVYERALRGWMPSVAMTAVACPQLVTMVEDGVSVDSPMVADACERYLAPVRAAGCDTVVMGCTHFPVYEAAIAAQLDSCVTLINSGAELAKTMAGESVTMAPEIEFFVSGDPAAFDAHRRRFLPELSSEPARQIDITQY